MSLYAILSSILLIIVGIFLIDFGIVNIHNFAGYILIVISLAPIFSGFKILESL